MKGKIYTDGYRISCGLCNNDIWLDGRNKKEAAKQARSLGWRETVKNGWVCCQDKATVVS